jgi:predicted translin family RNA/ssDNA-binding protein
MNKEIRMSYIEHEGLINKIKEQENLIEELGKKDNIVFVERYRCYKGRYHIKILTKDSVKLNIRTALTELENKHDKLTTKYAKLKSELDKYKKLYKNKPWYTKMFS